MEKELRCSNTCTLGKYRIIAANRTMLYAVYVGALCTWTGTDNSWQKDDNSRDFFRDVI